MPRPRTHDDALRARLLDVAGRELSAHGPQALSLRTIARAADTSTTAVYSLFGGKTELLAAVFDEAFRRFGARLATVEETGDPAADIVALGLAYRASAIADPHYYAIMFGSAAAGIDLPAESLARAAGTFAPLVGLVARAVAAGVLRDEDPADIATALWAAVHGAVSLELAGLLPDAGEERFAAAARAAVRGWAAPVR